MKIKTDHGEFEVKPLTFKDRRALHRMEVSSIKNGEIDLTTFYNALEWILDFAFENPEESLKGLDDNQIDEVLLAIYNKYKEPSKKK
jgi:hypothetical protein